MARYRRFRRRGVVTVARTQRYRAGYPTRTRTHARTRTTTLAGPTTGSTVLATATCGFAKHAHLGRWGRRAQPLCSVDAVYLAGSSHGY